MEIKPTLEIRLAMPEFEIVVSATSSYLIAKAYQCVSPIKFKRLYAEELLMLENMMAVDRSDPYRYSNFIDRVDKVYDNEF